MRRFIAVNWALFNVNMHVLGHLLQFNLKVVHRPVFELKTNMLQFPRRYSLVACSCGRMWHGRPSDWMKKSGWIKEIVHSSIGVYAAWDVPFVYNGVLEEDMKQHICYNMTMRWGRALFINGKCVHRGYLSKNRVKLIEHELKASPHKPTKGSSPYK